MRIHATVTVHVAHRQPLPIQWDGVCGGGVVGGGVSGGDGGIPIAIHAAVRAWNGYFSR